MTVFYKHCHSSQFTLLWMAFFNVFPFYFFTQTAKFPVSRTVISFSTARWLRAILIILDFTDAYCLLQKTLTLCCSFLNHQRHQIYNKKKKYKKLLVNYTTNLEKNNVRKIYISPRILQFGH